MHRIQAYPRTSHPKILCSILYMYMYLPYLTMDMASCKLLQDQQGTSRLWVVGKFPSFWTHQWMPNFLAFRLTDEASINVRRNTDRMEWEMAADEDNRWDWLYSDWDYHVENTADQQLLSCCSWEVKLCLPNRLYTLWQLTVAVTWWCLTNQVTWMGQGQWECDTTTMTKSDKNQQWQKVTRIK